MGSNCSNLNANAPMAQSQILCMPSWLSSEVQKLVTLMFGEEAAIGTLALVETNIWRLLSSIFFSFLSYFQSADSHGG